MVSTHARPCRSSACVTARERVEVRRLVVRGGDAVQVDLVAIRGVVDDRARAEHAGELVREVGRVRSFS
jgi:hypothetical protein